MDIVHKQGSILLLGRSGSGKTYCLIARMHYDYNHIYPKPRQLFISKTRNLCASVKAKFHEITELESNTVDDIDHVEENTEVQFHPYKTFAKLMFPKDYYDVTFQEFQKVEFEIFHKFFYDGYMPANLKLPDTYHVMTAWTQIRCLLKGSVEAVILLIESNNNQNQSAHKILSLQEYMNLEIFPLSRCKIKPEKRENIYNIYLCYNEWLKEKHYWDDIDCVLSAISLYLNEKHVDEDNINIHSNNLFAIPSKYDKIYVDEVQDLTQAEISLLYIISGCNSGAVFFVGDTAQTISFGSDFRFEEVSILHCFD